MLLAKSERPFFACKRLKIKRVAGGPDATRGPKPGCDSEIFLFFSWYAGVARVLKGRCAQDFM